MNKISIYKTIQINDTSMLKLSLYFLITMWSSWVEVHLCRFVYICIAVEDSITKKGRVGTPLIDLTLHMLCLSQSRTCISNLIQSVLSYKAPLYTKSLSIKGNIIFPINEMYIVVFCVHYYEMRGDCLSRWYSLVELLTITI